MIWWIRRDLRLHDNAALTAAFESGCPVIPVFIRDAHLEAQAGRRRLAFLHAGLHALDESLRRIGSRLVVRGGRPAEVLARLAQETAAQRVYAEEDFTPYARSRDTHLGLALPLELRGRPTVQDPRAVTKPDGSPYTVFTPFSRVWKALPLPKMLCTPDFGALGSVPEAVWSEALPTLENDSRFPPGEQTAQARLDSFLQEKILDYAVGRDRLDLGGTSCLSPYFHLGMLSARFAAARTRQVEDQTGPAAWINELIWRDFYSAIMLAYPRVAREAFNQSLQHVPWRDDPCEISAWKQGLTGYPVVDAAMRQLNETGWMHNRGRMIAASFLVKDLLVNWQVGEEWFMQQLIDGDIASNNGGWQWTAGVGTDAAPYFRIFSPVLQGKKFDPQGDYVRRWVPELRSVPNRWIHEPWLMPLDVQEAAGCILGQNYPKPVVDHTAARDRTISAYQSVKRRNSG